MNDPPGDTDAVAEALRRLAKYSGPEVANDALAEAPYMQSLLLGLRSDRLAAWLGGLLTLPRLQANADRLEWATRLALGIGGDGRAPRARDLDALLNEGLIDARVQFRDDPVESFFVAPVLTAWGEFRIFPGRWEGAVASTEDLLAGFLHLPDWGAKEPTLVECLSLLKLSDSVAERSRLTRREIGDGDPWGRIELPSEDRLRRLAGRVKFTRADLALTSIAEEQLQHFVLTNSDRPRLLSSRAGDTPLEIRPLVHTGTGYALVMPSAVSTAVRGRLIAAASEAHLLPELHRGLFLAQARRIEESGYTRLPPPRKRADGIYLREAALQLSPDRILHFVHTTSGFEGWPIAHFGSLVAMSDAWHRAVLDSIEGTRRWAEGMQPGAQVLTMLILGGWGGERHFEFPALPGWRLIKVVPDDLEILSALEDGEPADLFRLQDQLDRVRGLGFDILESNGHLNMVAWWRRTNHSLLPGNEPSLPPPQSIMIPIDMVLDVRKIAAELVDPRVLPRPRGPHLRVVRAEPRPAAGPLRPIYVATEALARGQLRGAAVADDECWWIDLDARAPNEMDRESWRAALRWLGMVMSAVLGEAGPAPGFTIAMRLAVEQPGELVFDQGRADPWDLRVSERDHPRGPLLTIGAAWHRATARATNDAELALAATLLRLAASLRGEDLTIDEAADIALRAVGSREVRFRHAMNADGALGILDAHGLLRPHRRIPVSAGALLKTGSAFLVRGTDEPSRIEGKGPCLDFLQAYVAEHWRQLLESVATFDRGNLVVAALSRFQSAMNEQRRWRATASALRAVHGMEADREASHDVMVRANGTMRASSLLAEIAGSQASLDNGLIAGVMDLDDLEARVLMLFLIEDAMAALRLDRARALLVVSPVGEVLFEQSFEEKTLRYTSTIRHSEDRERDVAAYARNFEQGADESSEQDPALAAAVEAEFGVDFLALIDLSFAPAALAIEDGGDVTVMRGSELVLRLERLEPFVGKSLGRLVDRLTLRAREGWRDYPPQAAPTEFDIARFDRRWSVSARPLVAITRDDDPLIVVAPGVLQRAVLVNLGGAMGGSLQGNFWESMSMRKFAGGRGGAAGMEFNHEVADAVRGLGMQAEVERSIPWCRQVAGTPELIALGDVDVLAVSPDRRRVWVIEAKELKLCRTLGEAARRLSEYRGIQRPDGKPDKLLKHLRRVEHLRAHAADLGKTLRLDDVPSISGVVIVGAPQPMEQAPANDGRDSKVIRLADLASIAWNTG